MEQYSDVFLNSEQVAKILRVTPRTLQNYRSECRIKFYRISPKNILYRVEDVVEFVKENSNCSYHRDRIKSLIEKSLVRYV